MADGQPEEVVTRSLLRTVYGVVADVEASAATGRPAVFLGPLEHAIVPTGLRALVVGGAGRGAPLMRLLWRGASMSLRACSTGATPMSTSRSASTSSMCPCPRSPRSMRRRRRRGDATPPPPTSSWSATHRWVRATFATSSSRSNRPRRANSSCSETRSLSPNATSREVAQPSSGRGFARGHRYQGYDETVT